MDYYTAKIQGLLSDALRMAPNQLPVAYPAHLRPSEDTMSKTITIISTHPETPRQRTIDVAKFAAFAAEFDNPFADHPPEVVHYLALGLVTYDGGLTNRYRVTPRGEDLLASVHLIPDDPAPEQPSAPPCEACNGTGEQMLLVSTHVCDVCKGSKTAPKALTHNMSAPRRGHVSAAGDQRVLDSLGFNPPYATHAESGRVSSTRPNTATLPRLGYSVVISVEPDGTRVRTEQLSDGRVVRCHENADGYWVVDSVTNPWTRIDSEEVARSFIGKRVEIEALATSAWAQHGLHGHEALLRAASVHGLYFSPSGDILWQERGNVRLRVVGGSDV